MKPGKQIVEEAIREAWEKGTLGFNYAIEELRREDKAARELDPDSAEAQDIERNR